MTATAEKTTTLPERWRSRDTWKVPGIVTYGGRGTMEISPQNPTHKLLLDEKIDLRAAPFLDDSGKATKDPDQGVPAWDTQKARTIFEQMLVKTSNKIDAVAAANDGLANAVVTALKAKKLKPIPLSGQDATAQGVQNVISGWQSGTVHKPAYVEATAAAAIAVALLKGGTPKVNGTTNNGVRNVPSSLATPIWITKKNVNLLYKDGTLKKSQVCVGSYKKYC